MDTGVQSIGGLGVGNALFEQTPEGGLYMVSRAAETIIDVEMSERGIQVVLGQKPHNPPPEPDTFRIGRRPGQQTPGFRQFVFLLLGRIGFTGFAGCLTLRLFGRLLFGRRSLRRGGQ